MAKGDDGLTDILAELIRRDGRAPRAISLSAGMAADTLRNLVRGSAARPRPKTLAAVAEALGVDVRVLTGERPLPPAADTVRPPPTSSKPRAEPSPPKTDPPRRPDLRFELRNLVRSAVRMAVAGGIDSSSALGDAAVAAMMAAVGLGLDSGEAEAVVGRIGLAAK